VRARETEREIEGMKSQLVNDVGLAARFVIGIGIL
jgi:hypothetical protein